MEGNATFAEGRPSLVFLRPHADPAPTAPPGAFIVVERAQGQFAIVNRDGRSPRLASAPDVGALVPPSAGRMARVERELSSGVSPRFAHDVLVDRPLEEAAREIAGTWSRLHVR